MWVNLELVRRCKHIPECYVCFDHYGTETGPCLRLVCTWPTQHVRVRTLAFSIYGVWEVYTTSSCFRWSLIESDEKERRAGERFCIWLILLLHHYIILGFERRFQALVSMRSMRTIIAHRLPGSANLVWCGPTVSMGSTARANRLHHIVRSYHLITREFSFLGAIPETRAQPARRGNNATSTCDWFRAGKYKTFARAFARPVTCLLGDGLRLTFQHGSPITKWYNVTGRSTCFSPCALQ